MARTLVTGILLSVCLASCSSGTPPAAPTLPSPTAKQPANGGGAKGNTAAAPTSSVPVELQARDLQQAGLSTADLTYHFHYLTTDKTAPLPFTNGVAHLLFAALPSGQAGDLTLEVLQNSVVMLRGVSANLTLTPGPMTVALALQQVSGTGTDTGTTTDTGGATNSATATATDTATATATGGASLTFARDVEPLFVTYCTRCHSTGGPQGPDLTQLPGAGLMDRILLTLTGPAPSMPTNGNPVSAADLATLQAWRNGGMSP